MEMKTFSLPVLSLGGEGEGAGERRWTENQTYPLPIDINFSVTPKLCACRSKMCSWDMAGTQRIFLLLPQNLHGVHWVEFSRHNLWNTYCWYEQKEWPWLLGSEWFAKLVNVHKMCVFSIHNSIILAIYMYNSFFPSYSSREKTALCRVFGLPGSWSWSWNGEILSVLIRRGRFWSIWRSVKLKRNIWR